MLDQAGNMSLRIEVLGTMGNQETNSALEFILVEPHKDEQLTRSTGRRRKRRVRGIGHCA